MRTILVNILAAGWSLATLLAGRLDLALVQFPEEKSAALLESALRRVNLSELTNADRTRTANAYLKGGYVLFAQSCPATPGANFSTSTRLKNSSVDVTGPPGQRIDSPLHLAHGRYQERIANVSEEGL